MPKRLKMSIDQYIRYRTGAQQYCSNKHFPSSEMKPGYCADFSQRRVWNSACDWRDWSAWGRLTACEKLRPGQPYQQMGLRGYRRAWETRKSCKLTKLDICSGGNETQRPILRSKCCTTTPPPYKKICILVLPSPDQGPHLFHTRNFLPFLFSDFLIKFCSLPCSIIFSIKMWVFLLCIAQGSVYWAETVLHPQNDVSSTQPLLHLFCLWLCVYVSDYTLGCLCRGSIIIYGCAEWAKTHWQPPLTFA